MQSARRPRGIGRVGTFGLVAVIVALAGCAGTLESLLPGSGPLVTIRLEGGMCPDGICKSAWVIQADGRVTTEGEPPEELGRASGEAMAALTAAVRATDYAAVRSRPFRGTCPTAYDGQEIVLEFQAPGGVQRLASCEVEIDWGHPLFAATVAALAGFVELPTEL